MSDRMNQDDRAKMLQEQLDVTREELKRSEREKKALVAEFAAADTYEDTLRIAKEAIADMLGLAITTTKQLLANAESESVRASLSKYVMDTVISGKLDDATDESLSKILQELTN